jgi:hypothetical protein
MRRGLQRSEDPSRAQLGDIDLVISWKHSVAYSEKRPQRVRVEKYRKIY